MVYFGIKYWVRSTYAHTYLRIRTYRTICTYSSIRSVHTVRTVRTYIPNDLYILCRTICTYCMYCTYTVHTVRSVHTVPYRAVPALCTVLNKEIQTSTVEEKEAQKDCNVVRQGPIGNHYVPAKNNNKIREIRISDQFRFWLFYNIFVKFGITDWIRIDSALLNTFANYDFYGFGEILTFS